MENKTYKLESELQMQTPIDVVCITEHWIQHDKISLINILNYKLGAQFSRKTKKGGGACIYTRSEMVIMDRKEVAEMSVECHFEACAIECIGINLVVVCIYRPPNGDIPIFWSKLNELLNLEAIQNYNVVVVGDINIDLMMECSNSKYLINTLKMYNFRQIVKTPTRVTHSSKTCIDHAYTNIHKTKIGNVFCKNINLSDHMSVNVILNVENCIFSPTKHIAKRTFSKQNICSFMFSLESYDWDNILTKNTCPNIRTSSVINVINHFYNIHFPIKKQLFKDITNTWVNDLIRKLRYDIHKTKVKLSKQPNDAELRSCLHILETTLWATLRSERKDYINNKIACCTDGNVSRAMWNVIASETCKRGNSRSNPINVLVSRSTGDCERSRAAAAADQLNHYYTQTNNINTQPRAGDALAYLEQYIADSPPTFVFEPFTLDEMISACKNVKRKQSKDINDMSSHILDLFPPVLISLLLLLLNECISAGVYPDVLKLVKVQPIYKGKGEMHVTKCYRPISLIPVVSKVFERLLSARLMKHFTSNNLLNGQQYAYQPGRSTSDAARDLIARVMAHLEGGRQVAAIFCDLSRAFEMIDHKLLLRKLARYGFEGNFLNTIASFLCNRQQSTYVLGARSKLEPIGSCSVPQGSVMGNNLFLALVNDITTACSDPEYIMFADDTCIIINAVDLDSLKTKANRVMHQIVKWFESNGMQLNIEKTNIMHFKLRKGDTNLFNIITNNTPLPQVNHVKYLGFTIDAGLTWSLHIDAACDKLSSACFALSRLSPTLSPENLRIAYYGYFHSILIQGVDLWGTAANCEKPFKLQKRALRIISGKPHDFPARALFKENKILTLPCIYILTACQYVRANLDQYTSRGQSHSRNTRGAHLLLVPSRRLAKARKSLGVLGVNIYNTLPSDIIKSPSDKIFTRKLKDMLIDLACYSIAEFMSK